MEYRQTDGRMQRSERTRALVVQAHADLLREGNLTPTAAQVADRAGVSRRTLWSNFGDTEGLLRNTVAYWFRLDDELRGEIDTEAPLDVRIAQFCEERERRLVNIAPAARAAALGEPHSPALRESRQRHIQRLREDLMTAFGPEIEAADDPQILHDALVAVVSWNAWAILYDDLGYGAEHCRRVMEHSLRSLLGAD